MEIVGSVTHCPKCDAHLIEQTDGSVLHADIAHRQETIPIALRKFQDALEQARSGHVQSIRLVVGRGLIRDEVNHQLSWLKHTGEVLGYEHDAGNTGAIIVHLRRGR